MVSRRYRTTLLAIVLLSLPVIGAHSQSTVSTEIPSPTGYDVTQIAGMPDAKPNLKGRLTASDTSLSFTNSDFRATIPFTRITRVSTGDVRIETGGKTGRIARTVIPFGGGMALAAVTHRSADLLTVEYVDEKGGYHGAVFYVPKASAKAFSDRIGARLSTIQPPLLQPCESISPNPSTVVVQPIEAHGVELPAEYRALLYEGLINELRERASPAKYLRAGSSDSEAGCAMKLAVTVIGFKKGNQALRASTGPIGLFVGKTSIAFHVELTAPDGRKVLAVDMSNSKRMDSESLGVAQSIAKSVVKKMRKLPLNQSANLQPSV